MQNFFLKIVFVACLVMPLVAKAQNTVTIGNGSGYSINVPLNSIYGYSFTEQVYPANLINRDGYITAVRFYYLGESAESDWTNNIVLYMKNVFRTNFSEISDYKPVAIENIAYKGQWTIPANTIGWLTIQLDTPFEYVGTSNLMIAMHEYADTYSKRYFSCHTTNNTGITFIGDTKNPDPYNLNSYSGNVMLRNQRNNMLLAFAPAVRVDGVDADRITFFPNPATETVTVTGINDDVTVSVIDMNGRTVFTANTSEPLTINLAGYSCGVYFVRISDGQSQYTNS